MTTPGRGREDARRETRARFVVTRLRRGRLSSFMSRTGRTGEGAMADAPRSSHMGTAAAMADPRTQKDAGEARGSKPSTGEASGRSCARSRAES